MKIKFENVLLIAVVTMMLTLGIFHSCNNVKEQKNEESVTCVDDSIYGFEFNNIEIINEFEHFYVIGYTKDSTTIDIYASMEAMNIVDSMLYSIENAESDSVAQELIDDFDDEVGYKWDDSLKMYVLFVK